MEREDTLELLRQQHTFPGGFDFRVVVRKGAVTPVVTAIVAAAGPGAKVENLRERESRKGTYTAVCVSITVDSAERVLDVYAVIKELPDVMTAL